MASAARFFLATPHPGPSGAAISIIHVEADSAAGLDELLRVIAGGAVGVGAVALRKIAGVDTGLVVRWTPTTAHLMPHGGVVVLAQIGEALKAAGVEALEHPSGPESCYVEAADGVEACALDTIARAASPLAIEVLLRQRQAWRAGAPMIDEAGAQTLDRLIMPPMVVVLGAPNIGKSTLTNALARRRVSIVADEPGTTRDHVGVMLDCSGLVVRWIDAPGINPQSSDPIERAAIALALEVAKQADLVLLCADSANKPPNADIGNVHTLRLGLRSDLGPACCPVDVAVSARTGAGITELALAVREALVPRRLLQETARWPFHPALPLARRGMS